MTFIKRTEPKRTCKDFKPSFWDRNRCKLTSICADTDRHILDNFRFCTGIAYLGPEETEEKDKYKMKRCK